MRYIFHFVLAWFLLCGFLASTQAAITGEALLDLCKTAMQFEGLPEDRPPTETELEDLMKKTLCVGYLMGAIDATNTWQGAFEKAGVQGVLFCLPEGGAEFNQTVRLVVSYLEAHPEDLHYRADSAVQLAFKDAFPCKEGGE